MLTPAMLTQIMSKLSLEKAANYLPFLVAGMREFRIDNELRVAAYLAQLAEESTELTHWEENLNYSAERLVQVWPNRFPNTAAALPFAHNPQVLAEKVYGSRRDLGNMQPGDGWKFRGRMPMQATGRAMYEEIGDLLGVDLVTNPDLALKPEIAFRASAAIFARIKGCNTLADGLITDPNNLRIITKRINGGYNGLAERFEYYRRARKILPDNLVLDGPDIVISTPAIDAGTPGNSSTDLDPRGSNINPLDKPAQNSVEPGKADDAAAGKPAAVVTADPAPPARPSLWENVTSYQGKLDKLTALKTSLEAPISSLSRKTFWMTKIGGWLLIALGFFVDHWLWFVGAALVAFAIWYLRSAKRNATSRWLAIFSS